MAQNHLPVGFKERRVYKLPDIMAEVKRLWSQPRCGTIGGMDLPVDLGICLKPLTRRRKSAPYLMQSSSMREPENNIQGRWRAGSAR